MKLIQGDCVLAMREMPDNCIDLTVTSPPYDDLRTYNGFSLDWKATLAELYRITKDGGVVVWIVADATKNGSESGTSFRQALWAKECGFNLHDTMIWDKISAQYPDAHRYYSVFEYMFVFSKGKPKAFNPIFDKPNVGAGRIVTGNERNKDGTIKRKSGTGKNRVTPMYGSRTNVWRICGEKANKTGHPAVFPLSIAKDHILTWSNEGDTVLDCFMGSGTTGVACANTGRDFIGIELDPTYFEIAKKRIAESEGTA